MRAVVNHGSRNRYLSDPGNILSSIANLVDAGLLRPHVSHRFALEDVAEGHRQVEIGRTVGKAAISCRR